MMKILFGIRSMLMQSMKLQFRPREIWTPLQHVDHTLGTLWISSYRLFKLRVSLRSAVPGVSLWVSAVPGPTSAGDAGMANGDSFSAIADFKGGTISRLHFSTRVLVNHSSNRLLSAAAKTESYVITITEHRYVTPRINNLAINKTRNTIQIAHVTTHERIGNKNSHSR